MSDEITDIQRAGETASPLPPEATSAPTAPDGPTPPAPPAAPSDAAAQGESLPENWPYKGYSGVQPYDANPPLQILHENRMLTSGTTGPEVVELAGLLEALGYETSISRGSNPHAIYETEMASAVRSFCTEYGVQEDPKIVAAMTPDVVGPFLWEALYRAVANSEGAQ